MRAWFWLSSTATLFSRQRTYSFFLRRHSRAASLEKGMICGYFWARHINFNCQPYTQAFATVQFPVTFPNYKHSKLDTGKDLGTRLTVMSCCIAQPSLTDSPTHKLGKRSWHCPSEEEGSKLAPSILDDLKLLPTDDNLIFSPLYVIQTDMKHTCSS